MRYVILFSLFLFFSSYLSASPLKKSEVKNQVNEAKKVLAAKSKTNSEEEDDDSKSFHTANTDFTSSSKRGRRSEGFVYQKRENRINNSGTGSGFNSGGSDAPIPPPNQE